MSLLHLWNRADAVIFDFDGVIADSEPLYRETWNRALHPGEPIPEGVYWYHWSFMGQCEGQLAEMGFSREDREALKARQKNLYRELCRTGRVPLFPEARELLGWVSPRKPWLIASNTDSELVLMILGAGGIHAPTVVGGEGLDHKPRPDIFLKAAETLALPPERCLVVEDSWKGLQAAAAGGFPAVLVRNHHNSTFPAESSGEAKGLSDLLEKWRGSN